MNKNFQLTEEELRYICSVIPHQEAIKYFTKNGKEFGKIRPGFRASSLSKADVIKLLFTCAHRSFISDFIDKSITHWLSEISKCYNEKIGNGEQKYIALINTLPFSYFADNIALYFKLSADDIPGEHIAILSAIIKIVKENSVQQSELKNINKEKDCEIYKLWKRLEKNEQESIIIKDKLTKKVNDYEDNRRINNAQLETLTMKMQENEQKYESIQNINKSYLVRMSDLETRLEKIEKERTLFSESIIQVEPMVQFPQYEINNTTNSPKKPKNMMEFMEYLGYNLECYGVSNPETSTILKAHLSHILFNGVPIVINRLAGINLARCVANTLTNKSSNSMLTYDKNISIDDVKAFVSSSDRVICLDNFIGNCNETLLIPVLESCKDKIVFMTIAYDGTLRHISQEFLKYVDYLNVNHIPELSRNAKTNEDPSLIEEIDYDPVTNSTNERFSMILQVIMEEVGYPRSAIEHRINCVSDEEILCQILAFDVLPYCSDVLQNHPYYISERLIKYAGGSGKCPYKQLFKEWFDR